MKDDKTVHISIGIPWIIILIILFWGEPDLLDGMIHYLNK